MMTAYKAIVTGGARGIGYALTKALLEAGGKVRFLDVLASEGVKAQKRFDERFGRGKAVFVHCDVSKKNELRDVFYEAKSQMEGLNVVCNNAAVISSDVEEEKPRFEEMMSINLGAVINGCFLGIELMGKEKGGNGGVIVNTSSIAALDPEFSYSPVYSSLKAAVVHFTRCIAQKSLSDHGVRMNCICPHGVLTEALQLQMDDVLEGRKKMPERVAQMDPDVIMAMLMKPTDISDIVMNLVNDDSKNNQVLKIIKNLENLEQIVVQNVPANS